MSWTTGTLSSPAFPLGLDNVDTDLIIPARYMKTVSRRGLGRGAFEALRREPNNVFDDPKYAGAAILLAGANFGCGSSREHAVWALRDLGVSAIVAAGFSDLFAGNACRNGILTVTLTPPEISAILSFTHSEPIRIDLEAQLLFAGDRRFVFECDPFVKNRLLNDIDEIALTLGMADALELYEGRTSAERPWTQAAHSITAGDRAPKRVGAADP